MMEVVEATMVEVVEATMVEVVEATMVEVEEEVEVKKWVMPFFIFYEFKPGKIV